MGINTKTEKRCCRDLRIYEPKNADKREEKKYIMVALDSCTIINMYKLISGHPDKNRENKKQYYNMLQDLLNKSVFDANGNFNPKGTFVFCLLPAVKAELSKDNGEIFESVKSIVENRMLALEIKPEHSKNFETKATEIANAYAKSDYLCKKDEDKLFKLPSKDAFILAQASIFNLILLSQDTDLVMNYSDKDPRRKIEHLKSINRRYVGGDFNGIQAEPLRLKHLYEYIHKNKTIPELENSFLLSDNIQQSINENLNYRQKRNFERIM